MLTCVVLVMQVPPPQFAAADSRIDAVIHEQLSSKYSTAKNALWDAWTAFLQSCQKTAVTANGRDVCRFLCFRDKGGKTKVHLRECTQMGTRNPSCACPKFLAAKTAESIVSRLNAQYKLILGEDFASPCQCPHLKIYIKGVFEQQAKGRVLAKQAVPLHLDKLRLVLAYLDRKLLTSLSWIERFNTLRDIAFFSMQFFAGDRCSDLLQTFTQDIHIVPGVGFRIAHFFGKVDRGKTSPTPFTVPVINERLLCPVRALKQYVDGVKAMGVSLTVGYTFRQASSPYERDPAVANYDNIRYRLHKHLSTLDLFDGENPHSLRAGGAITLAATSASANEVMSHIGWSTRQMLDHYTRAAAQRSAALASELTSQSVSLATDVAKSAMAFTSLPQAFP